MYRVMLDDGNRIIFFYVLKEKNLILNIDKIVYKCNGFQAELLPRCYRISNILAFIYLVRPEVTCGMCQIFS